MKVVLYTCGGIVGIVAVLFIVGMFTGPKTYADVAQRDEASCLQRVESDGWHNSNPDLTPENYCKAKGLLAAMKWKCNEHEEACSEYKLVRNAFPWVQE